MNIRAYKDGHPIWLPMGPGFAANPPTRIGGAIVSGEPGSSVKERAALAQKKWVANKRAQEKAA